jgi:tetratricopeptide (TPR) repeat protein
MANYNSAIRINPTSADAYYFRGAANQKMGNYQQALADYNQVINLDANRAIAYLDRGLIYDELDQRANALADFDQAAKLLENSDPVTHLMVSKKAQEIRQSLPDSQLSQAVVNNQPSEEIISEEMDNYAEEEYDNDDDDRRKARRIRPNLPIIIYHTETKTETKTETNNPPAKITRPRKSVGQRSRRKR